MPKRIENTEDRLYRKRARWYAYVGDLQGARVKQEALIPDGERYATKDRATALGLLLERVKELKDAPPPEPEPEEVSATLAKFVAYHLDKKAEAGKVREAWLNAAETRFRRAIEFLGAERPVADITVADLDDFASWLAQKPNGRGGTLSGGTIRHHLNDLSNLFRRAAAEGHVPSGHNPVGDMMEKPAARTQEAAWLEHHEAALLLEAARTYKPKREAMAAPLHAIVATMLLTGGRKSEVLGLAVDDVSFERKKVTFRPHSWRPLKTKTSHRSVPLWPQLEAILRDYLDGPDAPRGRLLFPSTHTRVRDGAEHMIRDLRRPLDDIAKTSGWKAGEIRTKMFRHTYCSARLQTVQRVLKPGADPATDPNPFEFVPVSQFTVSKEMGHGGTALVERVYGHLGEHRHRAEVVEYQPDVIERIGDAKLKTEFRRRLRLVRKAA